MKNKTKMTKDTVPRDFTLALALTDALPVLFFGGSTFIAARLLGSIPFVIGAALCFLAGAAKVAWKLTVAIKKKNVRFLFLQMRIIMPPGFILMLISLFVKMKTLGATVFIQALTSFPSVIFFIAEAAGILLMSVFAFALDSADARSNRIEQMTNTAAQAAFFTGLLFLL